LFAKRCRYLLLIAFFSRQSAFGRLQLLLRGIADRSIASYKKKYTGPINDLKAFRLSTTEDDFFPVQALCL